MSKKYQHAGIGMMPSTTELGKFIRARRLELDLRQVPLSKLIGFCGNYISPIELGRKNYFNDQKLMRLARALRVDPEELRKRMPAKHTTLPKTELGKLIRSRREELGLPLPAFAKKMKITPQKAKVLEVKKSPTIPYGLVKLLAGALEFNPSDLGKFVGYTRKETKTELGQLIRKRRKELGINTNMLAEKLNVTKQLVNQIELGQCPLSENDEMITKLAQILELDRNELEAVRPKRRRKPMQHISPLGEFLAARRLELRFNQKQVAMKAGTVPSTISHIERGNFLPRSLTLEKISKALECEIPAELVPIPRLRSPRIKT